MLLLRPMRADEFAGFEAYFIPDYAAELARNFDLEAGEAQARAMAELGRDLPQGVATPGATLLCIAQDDSVLGYLWCKADPESRSVFIYDFCILPAHRGKGFAKQALAALGARFAKLGFTELRLRVAADNDHARQVYLASGFRVTGFNMQKPI